MAEAFIKNIQTIQLRWLQRHFKCLHWPLRLCPLCCTLGSASRRSTRVKHFCMTEVASASHLRWTYRNAVTRVVIWVRVVPTSAARCQCLHLASWHGTLSGWIDLDPDDDCRIYCHLPRNIAALQDKSRLTLAGNTSWKSKFSIFLFSLDCSFPLPSVV